MIIVASYYRCKPSAH